jgi:hypothetical protein
MQGDCREETWRAYKTPISAYNGPLGSQAGNENKMLVMNYEQLLSAVFSCLYGQKK